MTRMLLIDTCTERGLVACVDEGEVLYAVHLPFGLRNSSSLLPAVEEALASVGWEVQQLEAVAGTVGPGSYTGIRVGAALLQSLSFSRDLPLIGLSALGGFVPDEDGSFAAIIDAKIGGAYILPGVKAQGKVEMEGEARLVPLERLPEDLKEKKLLISPNSQRLQDRIREIFPCHDFQWREQGPCAQTLAKQAQEAFERGNYRQDGHLPLQYLRKTQAEIEREAGIKH